MSDIESAADEYLQRFYAKLRTIQDVGAIPDSELLYHYTSLEGLLGIFDTREIWCSSVLFQNDRNELFHGLDVAHEQIDALIGKVRYENQKEYLTGFKNDLSKMVKQSRIYLFSTSSIPDLLSQWRGYAPGSTGVSIGLEKGYLTTVTKDFCRLWPAIYDRGVQASAIDLIVGTLLDLTVDIQFHGTAQELFLPCLARLAGALTYAIAAFKDPSFSEEKEWRLIFDLDGRAVDPPKIHHRVQKNILLPFIKIPIGRTGEGQEKLIKKIIVGPSKTDEYTLRSVEEFLKHKGLQNIPVSRSTIPFRGN
jgi:hypothetical protein